MSVSGSGSVSSELVNLPLPNSERMARMAALSSLHNLTDGDMAAPSFCAFFYTLGLYTLGAGLINTGDAYSQLQLAHLTTVLPAGKLAESPDVEATTALSSLSDSAAARRAGLLELYYSFPEITSPNGSSTGSVNYLKAALPILVALDHCDQALINKFQTPLYNDWSMMTMGRMMHLPNGSCIPGHGLLMLIYLHRFIHTREKAAEFDYITYAGLIRLLLGELDKWQDLSLDRTHRPDTGFDLSSLCILLTQLDSFRTIKDVDAAAGPDMLELATGGASATAMPSVDLAAVPHTPEPIHVDASVTTMQSLSLPFAAATRLPAFSFELEKKMPASNPPCFVQ